MLLPDQTYEQGHAAAQNDDDESADSDSADSEDDSSSNSQSQSSSSHSSARSASPPTQLRSRQRRDGASIEPLAALQKLLAVQQQRATDNKNGQNHADERPAKPAKLQCTPAQPTTPQPNHTRVSDALRSLFQLTFKGGNSAERPSDGELRISTPENFGRTTEFFNNIPDYLGDPFRPFSLSAVAEAAAADKDGERLPRRALRPSARDNADEKRQRPRPAAAGRSAKEDSADVLKECEQFLHTHRIRPDFFCRYRKAVV